MLILVPNELPDYPMSEVRSASTPNPLKRVTVTTTVSDEEGNDATETKKSKTEVFQLESLESPETKKSKKEAEKLKTPAKETDDAVLKLIKPLDAINQEQAEDKKTESNTQPEGKQPAQIQIQLESEESESDSKELDADLSQSKEEPIEFEEKTNPEPEKKMEKMLQEQRTQVEPMESQLESEPLQQEEQKENPKSYNLGDSDATPDEVDLMATTPSLTPNAKNASQVEPMEFMPKKKEEEISYYSYDSDATPDEIDSTATTPSPNPDAKGASIEDYAIGDDILEIQTSLDDVRVLHTPPSPLLRLQINEQGDIRSERLGSQDSDSSFKSSSQMVSNSGVEQLPEETSAATQIELQSQTQTLPPATALTTIQARRSTASVTTEPLDMSINTYNSSEAAGSSSIAQTMYSPIDMPSLDDEELDRFVGA